MSRNIDPIFEELFDTEVKAAYGDKSKLKPTVRTKLAVVGKSAYFNKKGKGLATQHIRGADRTGMNITYSRVECQLSDWDAYDYVDKFDMKKVGISEIKEAADVASTALGLRSDQLIINALNTGYDTSNMSVGTTNTNLTVDTLRAAAKKLNDNGVPSENRTFIHSSQQLDDLLSTTQATSSDYNAVKALVDGQLKRFMGFDFIMIAARDEGGLPSKNNGADVCGFVYHKDAVGYAEGQDIETSIDWLPKMGAWQVGGDMSAGAVVIDDKGIVAVISDID